MKRSSVVVLLLTAVAAYGQTPGPKKRIAIMNFEYATVMSDVAALFGTNRDIGKGIADILVDRLVNDGRYSVIERKELDKIMAEQNFSNSDRADPNTAAKLARILGVDAIVIGSITQFGRDDKNTNIGGGALSAITGRYGLGGVSKREAKAAVQISARLISTETAEILAVAQGKGASQRGGTSLLGAGGGAISGGGNLDMSSSNFANTLIGEAVNQAVTEVANKLEADSAKLPSHVVQVSGVVADVSGASLVLNIGSRAGIKVGDRLAVKRSIREIKDPTTGKVLRRMEDNVGEVTITEVDDTSSVGKFTGPAPAKVGDSVRSM